MRSGEKNRGKWNKNGEIECHYNPRNKLIPAKLAGLFLHFSLVPGIEKDNLSPEIGVGGEQHPG